MRPSPMLAQRLVGSVPKGYVFEPKLDGHRVIVRKVGSDLQVYTRTGHDQSGKLPHLEAAFLAIPLDFTLDGEAVSIRKTVKIRGQQVPISTLSTVQSVMGSSPGKRVRGRDSMAFVAFDVLETQGKNVMDVPDVLRRGLLEMIVDLLRVHSDSVLLMPRWKSTEDPNKLYEAVIEAGGEGLVAKNTLATYHSGKRPHMAWYKMKEGPE